MSVEIVNLYQPAPDEGSEDRPHNKPIRGLYFYDRDFAKKVARTRGAILAHEAIPAGDGSFYVAQHRNGYRSSGSSMIKVTPVSPDLVSRVEALLQGMSDEEREVVTQLFKLNAFS